MKHRLLCVALVLAVFAGGCTGGVAGQATPAPGTNTGIAAAAVASVTPTSIATFTPAGAATSTPTSTATFAPASTPADTPTSIPGAPGADVTPTPTVSRVTAAPGDGAAAASASRTFTTPSTPAELVADLRNGGYILYFRHAATDPSPDDANPVVLTDCGTQRNLSAAGRTQAAAIGAAINRLAIPIGNVLSSPFCRALDTARLAFGKATPEPVLENLETADTEAVRQPRVEGLRRLLAAEPEPGTNTVLVAHGVNIAAAASVSIAEGEAAVFRPQEADSFTLVGRLTSSALQELAAAAPSDKEPTMREYPVPAGGHPHDVAPAPDGTVWYTAQGAGELGLLDPRTGEVKRIPLGQGSAPHGVIVGPDRAAWVTDGGLNAILRVDAETHEVRQFPLPPEKRANLNTATFDQRGILWFTGQSGYYGRVDPKSGRVDVFDAPRGRGPYGIATTPGGDVYYASLAGSHIARIDLETGEATVIEPPTPHQGARRVWSDSQGRLWVSEWNAGQLGMYDPTSGAWREWKLPGANPLPYSVYVDDRDMVWLSDFAANTFVRFDPKTEQFTSYPLPSENGQVRQMLGRPGEVWGAESGANALVVVDSR